MGEGPQAMHLLTYPYASPLFGELHSLPPLLIQCGECEVLRDEGTLLAHKASRAGVPVRHELYEDCLHVFQAALFLDASRKALSSAAHFVRSLGSSLLRTLPEGEKEQQDGLSDATRAVIDEEMEHDMENTQGQLVEPSTGQTTSATPSLTSTTMGSEATPPTTTALASSADGSSATPASPPPAPTLCSASAPPTGGPTSLFSSPPSRTYVPVDMALPEVADRDSPAPSPILTTADPVGLKRMHP